MMNQRLYGGIAEEILDRDGDDMESALRKAAEMCGDIHGVKTDFVKMSLSPAEKGFDEVRIIDDILKEFCGDDVSLCFSNILIGDGKFTAKFFAHIYDASYMSWEELFANESAENITAMIENGLNERKRIRLGTEKSFFAACLRNA